MTLPADLGAAEDRGMASRLSDLRALLGAPRPGYDERLQALARLADEVVGARGDAAQLAAVPGAAFLASFLRPDHLEHLVASELPLAALRQFAPFGPRRELRLVPKGVACHWVAGNVPLLGLLSWAVSALLGNLNVVRVSSRQDDLLSPLLRVLASVSPAGASIARETVVLQFDRTDDQLHRAMSAVADIRIAWGGREAVEAVMALPCDWECETVVLGPRMSIAAIDPAVVSRGELTRLAADIVYFDQQACSSPQFVFVKGERGDPSFDAAVERLSAAINDQAGRFPRHRLDYGETYRIALDRARLALSGGSLRVGEGTAWTVATVDRPSPDVRCANRFVQAVPFQTVAEILPFIPRNVQSAVVALAPADYDAFTESAALRGVCRFPRPGQGNFFETPWDGVPLAARLVRWVVRAEHRPGLGDRSRQEETNE